MSLTTRTWSLLAALLFALPSWAETPQDVLRNIEAGARSQSTSFNGFSATRGERFFQTTHGTDWSCATCHTQRPTQSGQHAITHKSIEPLAPAANAQRFTRPDKVAKWFKRNCNDVLKRACTPQEQGDVLTYLLSLK